MSDAEFAKRLLDRHAREVARHIDDCNLQSAEDLLKIPLRTYLKRLIERDTNKELRRFTND